MQPMIERIGTHASRPAGSALAAWRSRVAALGWSLAGWALAFGCLLGTAPARAANSAAPAASAPAAAGASAAAAAPTVKAPVVTGRWVHALTAFGEPKYPPGFTHFAYVDPDAPKGGMVRLSNPDRRSSFDKYNPFTIKGVPPAAMTMFIFESLAVLSMDESMTMYGLLAESMFVSPDMRAITFRLHPQARFSDGSPVLADDVVYSYQQLITGKGILPAAKQAYEEVSALVAVDARTVRFEFKSARLDNLLTAGGLTVFSRRWGGGKPLDQLVTEIPIATGPYAITKAEMPRRLELTLRPDYWARNLGVRRGHYNFGRINYQMYKDTEVRREAFKAGEFHIMQEYRASQFVRAHQGPKWRDGRIVKNSFQIATGSMPQSFNLNQRRPQFQDIRVREAIQLAFDFERYNRYGTFLQSDSLFNNTEFAAQGLPSADELRLLEPFRSQLPARVFGQPYRMPRQDAHPLALRENLRRAAKLLAEAGWKVGPGGLLRNAQGQTLDMEYLDPNDIGRWPEYARNLKLLGINYTERLVDYSLFNKRLDAFDFDVVIIVEPKFTLPDPATVERLYGSKMADVPGGSNYRGIKHPAVDALLQRLSQASNRDELRSAARALDRVVMWHFWSVPMLYTKSLPTSYWNRFGIPAVQPLYFRIDTNLDEHSQPWPLFTWWDRSIDTRPAAAAPRAASAAR